jgi:UrcA family protein
MRSIPNKELIMSKRLTKLLAVAAALAITGIAGATTGSDAPSTVVRYSDLSLASKAGVVKLHARLRSAAQIVCSGVNTQVLSQREHYDTCVKDAINQGVAAVGNENLTNYHRYRRVGLFASNRH